MNALTFNNITLSPVPQNDGQIWLTSRELGQALGYAREDAVNKIYERNADEFTSQMTCNVKMTLKGQNREVRIFSLRGCHLIAMFARTKIAKQFRIWVLDILDKEVGQPAKTTKDDRTPLRQAVSALIGKTNLAYDEAYRMVHQYMGVNHIDQIAPDDLPKAIAYVHKLTISGGTPIDQDAEYNALWRTIGLLEYERISKERRKLQQLLNDTLKQFQTIHASEGLLYDAIAEQRINTSTASSSPQERLAKAQAFINRQLAMKG